MCGSISGTPRMKRHLSNRGMACSIALSTVHVAPASSPWRMLRSPYLQALAAGVSVHGSAKPPEGAGRRRSNSRSAA